MVGESEDSKERALKDQVRVKGKQRLGRHRTKAMVKKRVLSLSFAQIELWGVKC